MGSSHTVVRATLTAPSWTRADAHQFKPRLREAMHDVLPSHVWERDSKDSFTSHAYQGLRRNAPAIRDLLTTSRLAESGIVDSAPALVALERAVDGRTAPLGALAHLITAEMWVRSLEHAPTWWTTTPQPVTVREEPR